MTEKKCFGFVAEKKEDAELVKSILVALTDRKFVPCVRVSKLKKAIDSEIAFWTHDEEIQEQKVLIDAVKVAMNNLRKRIGLSSSSGEDLKEKEV